MYGSQLSTLRSATGEGDSSKSAQRAKSECGNFEFFSEFHRRRIQRELSLEPAFIVDECILYVVTEQFCPLVSEYAHWVDKGRFKISVADD